MANNNFNAEETEESKYKNEANAKENYNYYLRNKDRIPDGYTVKIHDGFYETIRNPYNGTLENLWKIINLRDMTISWKDPADRNFSMAISFHDKPIDFENKLNVFLSK